MTRKNIKEYITKGEDGNLDLSLKYYIKDNFGDEFFETFKKEYEDLNENEKKVWGEKVIKLIKEKIENENL